MPKKTTNDLETLYVDAIQDAFLAVQKEYETDADERLAAQTLALRQCLADCNTYQQELDEETKIAHYGDDLPDDIMPKELNNAAA